MINNEQEIRMEISYYKYKLRNVLKENPGDALEEIYSFRIQGLQGKLAQLQNNTPKGKYQVITPESKKKYYDSQRHYYEVEINGDIFLECTSCSADGPGNCNCWSID